MEETVCIDGEASFRICSSSVVSLLEKDIVELEKVQKRALRIPQELRFSGSYEYCLERMGLTSLEDRRKRGDLIQLYKFTYDLEKIDRSCLPKPAPSRGLLGPACATRGNTLRLVRQTFGSKTRNDLAHFTTVRDQFFPNRVVGAWNELPESIIRATSTNSFKSKLDDFVKKVN